MTDSVDIQSGLSQSFKHGTQYKERLTNFRGPVEVVVADVIKFFGLSAEEVEGLTPFEIIALADQYAQGVRTVASILGGTPVAESAQPSDTKDPWDAAESGQASKPAETKPPADPKAELLSRVKTQATRDELRRLYIEEQATFDADAELMAAWKAHGKGLPA